MKAKFSKGFKKTCRGITYVPRKACKGISKGWNWIHEKDKK